MRYNYFFDNTLQLFVSEMMNFYIPDLTQKLSMKFFAKLRREIIKAHQKQSQKQ